MCASTHNDNGWVVRTLLFAPLTWLLGITAIAISVSAGFQELLQFDAVAIAGGEYWRFLTGHLVHWNFDHLFWDLSVFVVLGALCERRSRKGFLACVFGSAAAISLYLLVALPELPIYRGLSGIDTGLFVLLGVSLLTDARASGNRTLQWLIAAAMLGLFGKTVYEFGSEATIFVDYATADFVPITMAHVLGALVGLAVGLATQHRCCTPRTVEGRQRPETMWGQTIWSQCLD